MPRVGGVTNAGVNLENVEKNLEAGANVIVAGSAVFKGDITANTKAFLEKMTHIDEAIAEIEKLSDSINSYAGSNQNNAVLGGFIAEEWHAGRFAE